MSGKDFQYRQIVRIEEPNRHVIEVIFEFPGRPPLKVAEVVYTRR